MPLVSLAAISMLLPAPALASSASEHSFVPKLDHASRFPSPIRHVVVVLLENAAYKTVLAKGPFERYLASTYVSAANFYAACHPSSPNYLALTSGNTWQCGSDAYHVYSTVNVADVVQAAHETWGAFQQSIPAPCYVNNSLSGLYVFRHDPMVFYKDIVGNATRCQNHVVNFAAWNTSVSTHKIPNYSFITPNVLNDGHNTGVAFADAWLKLWLSPLINDSSFNSTAYFILYDEGARSGGYTSGNFTATGGHVFLSVVSRYSVGGRLYQPNATDFNLLTTVEWLLGTGNCGHNDTSQFPPMKRLFRFP